jgi:hypothetical protein
VKAAASVVLENVGVMVVGAMAAGARALQQVAMQAKCMAHMMVAI